MILDAVLALIFGSAGLSQVATSSIGLLPAAAGPPLAWIAGLALLFRRYFPIPVLIIAAISEMAVGTGFPLILAMYTVANRYGNRIQTWLCAAGAAVIAMVPWGVTLVFEGVLMRALVGILMLAVPLLLGLWTNQRAQLIAGLRERAEQAERERDLRAAAAVEAERIRIARELHDIVAHRISQITVLAGALEVSADGRPAEIAGTIRDTGTRALNEMRELLGVLRQDVDAPPNSIGAQSNTPAVSPHRTPGASDVTAKTSSESMGSGVPGGGSSTGPGWGSAVPLRPAPDLHAVAELIEEAVVAGQRVDSSLPDELPDVPGPVGRAAYRVVQEALTNAAKHAAGAEVRVELAVRGGALEVDVRNGRGERTALARQGSGFGLVGMRERVELAGGTLHSGASAAGGFAVHARFPLEKEV